MSGAVILYGGSFDPVHNGHLHIAKTARAKLKCKSVLFIPAHQNPMKDDLASSGSLRLKHLRLALKAFSFKVSTHELEREGTSYTIDTLHYFQKRFPKKRLYWLMGADVYKTIERWKDAEKIRDAATVVVVVRGGHPIKQKDSRDILLKAQLSPWSSTKLRRSLAKGRVERGAFPKPLEKHLKKLILNGKNPYASL